MKNAAHSAALFLFVTFHSCLALGQSVSGTVNNYYQVVSVSTATNSVTLSNASGLTAGQRVMLYQAKGATINSSNASSYGDITALNMAGAYEFNTICSIAGNQVWLLNAMLNSYAASGLVQLVTVPSSPSIIVAGTVSAAPWDPTTGTGGIVALESSGTIILNADIDVSGLGFQGGPLVNNPIPPYNCSWAATVDDYYLNLPASGFYTGGTKGEGITPLIVNEEYGRGKLANGGGGGNNTNTGGAGGGNYGPGGDGGQRAGESTFSCHGQYPGIGGAGLSSFGYSTAANRIFFGGGGGAGQENNAAGEPGANGGGIILLSAPTITGGGGQLLATGLQPINPANTADPLQAAGDGGGGGGAGGTIILNAASFTATITADVTGGRGSNSSNGVPDCTGPGGGGAGGVVWVSGGSFPAAISPALTGGANGVVSSGSSKTVCVGSSDGATAGSTGASLTGYTLPVASAATCSILANPAVVDFTARRVAPNVLLDWTLSSSPSAAEIRYFVIQRSVDLTHFDSLATVGVSQGQVSGPKDQVNFEYIDAAIHTDGALAYRLAWTDPAGQWSYSRIVSIRGTAGPDAGTLRLYPNPAEDHMTLTVISTTTEKATIRLSNGIGQTLQTQAMPLHDGLNSVSISLATLAPGAYFLILESAGKHLVKPFLKKAVR